MQSKTESRLITVQEAAKFLALSTSTLYGWVYQRRIPFVKVGGALQARGSTLTSDVKTKNAIRDIDVHPEVAKLLRQFIGTRKGGLLFGSRTGRPLSKSNIRNRSLYPILEAKGVEKGGPHVFRRFRATWLRKQKTPEDLIRLWLGHGGATVTDLYVNIEKEKTWRKKEAARVGVGFALPTSVVPNVPKVQQACVVEIAA